MKNAKPCCTLLLIALILPATVVQGQSPYARSWSRDGVSIGAGAALALVAYVVNDSLPSLSPYEISQLSRESVAWFDRSATCNYSERADWASDILLGITVATPVLLLADKRVADDWQTFSLMYSGSLLFSSLLPYVGKGIVQRIRPYAYNPEAPMEQKMTSDARRSFFSGHTSVAFASGVFLSSVYEQYYPSSRSRPLVWGASLLLATVVGFLRYEAGMHYPSDVLVGAVVGSAVGYAVPLVHKKSVRTPPSSPGTDGLTLSIAFHIPL